jgi:hypothetical protein
VCVATTSRIRPAVDTVRATAGLKGGVTLQIPAASRTEVTSPEPLIIRTVAGLPLDLAGSHSPPVSHSSGDVRPSGIIPVDKLKECTVFATALLHLIEQREFVAVKSAEPLIPAKVLQLVFPSATREIEAQHTS